MNTVEGGARKWSDRSVSVRHSFGVSMTHACSSSVSPLSLVQLIAKEIARACRVLPRESDTGGGR